MPTIPDRIVASMGTVYPEKPDPFDELSDRHCHDALSITWAP